MLKYVAWTIFHLGAWGLMLLASAGVGQLFLRKADFHSLAERLVFTLALGMGFWALALFCLGLTGALYGEVILGLTVVGAAGAILYTVYHYKRNRRALLRASDFYRKPYVWLKVGLSLLAIGYWALLCLLTQYPPIQWDATSNHLVLARAYLEQHRIDPVLGVVQPVVPALNHMLFAWGLALKDDILSQMAEHTLLMLVALGLYTWFRRENRPVLGMAAACLWLTHPLTIWLGQAAYTDVGAACYTFLGLYALYLFWNERKAAWWYLSMALLAMAAGAKLSGLFFLLLGSALGIIVLAQSVIGSPWLATAMARRRIKTTAERPPLIGWKPILLGWAVALLIAAPWFGFIASETGNPVWPALPQFNRGIWGAPDIRNNFAAMLDFTAAPRTVANFLKLPFDWKYHPDRFKAEAFQSEARPPLSPLMLFWPFTWVVALWNRRVRWWAAWALAFTLFWFFHAQQLRYWLPALPMAGLALYESIRWFVERFWKSAVFHHVIWIALILFTTAWGSRIIIHEAQNRGEPPVTATAREAFINRSYGGYDGVKYINENSDRSQIVCILGGSWLNYYFQPQVIDLVSPLFVNRRPTFRWPNDQAWVQWLNFMDVEWIFIDHADLQGLYIPKLSESSSSFWPGYQFVYANSVVWIFRRKLNSTSAERTWPHRYAQRLGA